MALSGKENPKADRLTSFTWRMAAAFICLILFVGIATRIASMLYLTTDQLTWILVIPGILLSIVLAHWVTRPFRRAIITLDGALRSYRGGDFSLRLAPPKQPETVELFNFYNSLADLAREERNNLFQKELLLDTVVQSSPLATLLLGPTDVVILANGEARRMFQIGKPITGLPFSELLKKAPPTFAETLEQNQDALFNIQRDGEMDTYHLSHRNFQLNAMSHKLITIRRLTKEMRRQEIRSWKKLIRLINHELNNTLAPMRSLLHSARTIVKRPDQTHKLGRVIDTLESTAEHLQQFLEGYAAFARLPDPRKQEVRWSEFLEELNLLMPFKLVNRLASGVGFFDPSQLQQALINLLKNAREASEPDANIEITIGDVDDNYLVIQVSDRGRGMSEESMQKALLPFFSTKSSGTGLGLPLCREIIESHEGTLKLQPREGGGLTVSCILPKGG